MGLFSSGEQRFKRPDGSTYSVPSRTFQASNTREAMQKRQDIIDRETSKGNKRMGGGSLGKKG